MVAPSNPGVLYAVTWVLNLPPGTPLLWRSADAGVTWTPIDAQLPLASAGLAHPPYLVVDPHDAQRIFVGAPQGVWESNTGGARWSEHDLGLPHGVPGGFPFPPMLAVSPLDPNLVYAGAADIGVYRSHDGGRHWQPILAGLPPLNPVANVDGSDFYLTLVPDPQDSNTVYLGTLDNGLLVYTAH